MKYDHMVKINGAYYHSGQEVPEGIFDSEKSVSPSGNTEDNAKHYDEQPKRQYGKTDINRMSTSELQNLAAESGVENAFEKSGGELKKLLIEKFGL